MTTPFQDDPISQKLMEVRKANALWNSVGNRGMRFVLVEPDEVSQFPGLEIYDAIEESMITFAKMRDWMDTVNFS
jgi:hypothetical protein